MHIAHTNGLNTPAVLPILCTDILIIDIIQTNFPTQCYPTYHKIECHWQCSSHKVRKTHWSRAVQTSHRRFEALSRTKHGHQVTFQTHWSRAVQTSAHQARPSRSPSRHIGLEQIRQATDVVKNAGFEALSCTKHGHQVTFQTHWSRAVQTSHRRSLECQAWGAQLHQARPSGHLPDPVRTACVTWTAATTVSLDVYLDHCNTPLMAWHNYLLTIKF